MPDIVQLFSIKSAPEKIYAAVSSPAGLDAWWTKRCSGKAQEGARYELFFGPGYDWRAVVSQCIPDRKFELRFISAHEDWQGARVGFALEEKGGATEVRFHHLGWPAANDHFQASCYCWAMYLRLLKRYVERGEVVPYEQRLEA
jgi:uncharacterized protein YndB with AHSA1/START domain